MSHYTVNGDQQRPSMRRKSSAQNLLSSFTKSSNNSSSNNNNNTAPGASSSSNGGNAVSNSNAAPPPPQLPTPINTSAILSAGMQYAGASATPTASTPHGKDWDAQSLHSDTVAGSTLGSVGSPLIAQGTSVESLRPLVQKRIVTLTYLRNVHEGCDAFASTFG